MSKHIILTKLFDTGGSNAHLKLLLAYFGEDNVVLVLEDDDQKQYIKNISPEEFTYKIIPGLHPYAHLCYHFSTNVKELFYIIRSLMIILFLSIRYNFATITISAVESERYLYLLWLPFIKTTYILHTAPPSVYTTFTTFTCNNRLGANKKIVTVSEYMGNLIAEQWGVDSTKQPYIRVIHNSLPANQEAVSAYEQNYERPRIVLTVGRIDSNKNPQTWLQVARAVTAMRTNVIFKWLGNGPDFEQFADSTSTDNRIIFAGLVTNPQPYLQSAYLYYQPSFVESHGIAVLEAMNNALPCVVSNTGGLPESVKRNYNGLLVQPTNLQQHVDAIVGLLDNENTRNCYGHNSFTKYRRQFSYQHFKQKMDEVYGG